MAGLLKQSLFALLGLTLLVLPLLPAAARSETLGGPIAAQVLDVVDGDTVLVRARIWLGQEVVTKVRLAEIDTPELGGRAKCKGEGIKAEDAKARLEDLAAGQEIFLFDVAPDKYAGRVIARLELTDGTDPGQVLLAEGLAVPYDPRTDWCLIE